MFEDLTFSWQIIVLPLAALVYLELMRRLEKYWAGRRQTSDVDRLWQRARDLGVSEHEVFKRAAAKWSLSPEKADLDFKTYLKRQHMPYYVRDYVRKG